MKKIFELKGLDCANCATKIENRIRNINGVHDAVIDFMSQKFFLEADNNVFEDIFKKSLKEINLIDKNVKVII